MKYLLSVRFVGTAYRGYQVQKNGPTVQAELNRAAEELFGYPCDVTGCSRTDCGVHAEQFCATVTKKGDDALETGIPPEKIPAAFNAHLPEDISVYEAKAVSNDFHPRYGVKAKEYRYRIWNDTVRNPFETDRSAFVPGRFSDEDVARMNAAASAWIGTHDFRSYMAQGSKVVSTVRTVYEAEVTREGRLIVFRVSANGFLYNMVRIMTGTLLSVGEGKLSPEDIPRITESLDRKQAGKTAPACGLYLYRVLY